MLVGIFFWKDSSHPVALLGALASLLGCTTYGLIQQRQKGVGQTGAKADGGSGARASEAKKGARATTASDAEVDAAGFDEAEERALEGSAAADAAADGFKRPSSRGVAAMRERCAREVSTTSGRSLAATYLVVAVALALAAFGPPRQTSGLVAPSPPPPPSPTAGHTKVHHQAHHPAKSNHPPRAPPSHLREVSPPPPARAEKRPPTSTRDAGTGVHEVRPAKSAGDAAAARLPPPDAAEL